MSVREIQAFLAESYGTEVSPDFISSVTGEVMAEALSGQNRPLETMYPVVFFDGLRVKIRDDGVVSNKAVYLALGIQANGQRDVLGLWIERTEGAKCWLKVFNELKTRGCQDILIAVVDGLEGAGRRDRRGLPEDRGTNLHRAPDPEQPGIRRLEGPQGCRAGAASYLRGCQRRGGEAGSASLC